MNQPPRRRTGLNLWLALAVLPILSFTCWYSLHEDDGVASADPPPLTTAELAPVPPPRAAEPVEARAAGVDAGELDAGPDGGPSDAGSRAGSDAGVPRVREPTAAEVAVYIAKWRAALEPILRNTRPMEPKAITTDQDAGVMLKPKCVAGVQTFPMGSRAAVDFVVAVDTSGSMFRAGLDITADFLGRLEHHLVTEQVDFRLIVLAEPRVLKLTTDAGVSTTHIQSHDGLDVLINTARDANPHWLQLVREDAELRVLLITDDGPASRATEPDFSARLTRATARTHSFSVLGGFATEKVLTAKDPLRGEVCNGVFGRRNMVGLDPGLVYQQVANTFGGVRASICSETSRAELLAVFGAAPPSGARCEWSLNAEVRVLEVRGRDARGNELFLVREPNVANCPGLHQSYVFVPPLLAICPDTCAELKLRNVTEVQLRIDCGN